MNPSATTPGPDLDDRCPRCGGAFRCWAHDGSPCPCGDLTLPPQLLRALRERYNGCLCLTCLAAMATQGLDPP